MKQNVGGIDRIVRALAGVGLIAWGLYAQNLWGAVGIIPVVTAALGWCPAYLPLGLSTCSCKTPE